ncbi:hypothetical protein KIN20_010049 [Parelaphostrongylus tenuis]|nr:hypothetical protein KIN20_010049 [Parelaphostrongylus tenuis]
MLYRTVIHNILIVDEMMAQNCIVVGSTVTRISTVMTDQEMKMCTDPQATIGAIPTSHTEKTAQTTNIIMAIWTRMMWQSLLDRAIRMLALATINWQAVWVASIHIVKTMSFINSYHCSPEEDDAQKYAE